MKRIEKLTAEHLAIYLAYGLTFLDTTSNQVWKLIINDYTSIGIFDKPILRTRQSITPEELELFSIDFRLWYNDPCFNYEILPYKDIIQMAKLHVDIFGLIESGLAVDKETIKNSRL